LQEELAQLAVEEGWTVRGVELAVKSGGVPTAEPAVEEPPADEPPDRHHDGAGVAPTTRLRPPGLLELEELLAEHLDTRVHVQMGARKGKVTIDFADLEDLERIYRRMTEPG
jgi:ParB family chromosome partitioning protein